MAPNKMDGGQPINNLAIARNQIDSDVTTSQ